MVAVSAGFGATNRWRMPSRVATCGNVEKQARFATSRGGTVQAAGWRAPGRLLTSRERTLLDLWRKPGTPREQLQAGIDLSLLYLKEHRLDEAEQLSLLQKLTRLVSERPEDHRSELCRELDAMAADLDIQRELKAIEVEFEHATSDGLNLFT